MTIFYTLFARENSHAKCDNNETLELKFFDLDEMPDLFCKQHEDIKKELLIHPPVRRVVERFIDEKNMKQKQKVTRRIHRTFAPFQDRTGLESLL